MSYKCLEIWVLGCFCFVLVMDGRYSPFATTIFGYLLLGKFFRVLSIVELLRVSLKRIIKADFRPIIGAILGTWIYKIFVGIHGGSDTIDITTDNKLFYARGGDHGYKVR